MKTPLYTHEEARHSEPADGALASLSEWLRDYAMSDHAELGRSGTVCPFVKQASKLETLRVGINLSGPEDEDHVFSEIRTSFHDMEHIPAPPGKERLRTIAVGFPNCASLAGIAMLERVYKRHKYYTLLRSRMDRVLPSRRRHPRVVERSLPTDAIADAGACCAVSRRAGRGVRGQA
ncbi:MAG: hypothetical protein IPO30_17060 [Hyphomonadaceae bacterium]|nr:hypothetical protein [Hyphomonadaceae bacterium]